MKKSIAMAVSGLLLSGAALAGVSNISSNGTVSGVPSHRVQCSGGSSHIVYHKNGTWYSGASGHMGNKYDSWSVNQLAAHLCK